MKPTSSPSYVHARKRAKWYRIILKHLIDTGSISGAVELCQRFRMNYVKDAWMIRRLARGL